VEHLLGVGLIRGAAEANAELWRRLKPSGTAIVNADDPHLRAVENAFEGRRIRFGDAGEVRALAVVDRGIDGTEFVLASGDARHAVRLQVAGRHNVANALAATAAAQAIGVPLETACAALATFAAPSMRMQRVTLASGVVVLNDCYNANPGSMAAAIQTLAASRAGRRLAVLGEMLELGASAEEAHREVGRRIAAAGVDALFLIGTHAALVRDAALGAGLAAERITLAATHEALADAVRATMRAGDLVLLKGSRGAALEKVLRRLEPEPPA
jgi:UDP-N-acetylmuramoyl-tripeptide--D-alanyl-D-alanine ligase